MKKFSFVEVSQKVFNRNVRRLTQEAINTHNVFDNKTKKLLRDYVSEKLNRIIEKDPNVILDTVKLDLYW